MDRTDTVQEAVQRLDTMERETTRFEAGVLETVMRQLQHGQLPSPKQTRILCEMIEEYLDDPLLAAELRGQLRLLV